MLTGLVRYYIQMQRMDFDAARFASTLVSDMAEAAIYADADGIVRFWKHGAERIFGFSNTDAIGKSLDIIIPESLRQRHWMVSTRR